MKFIVDAQLPPSLAKLLQEKGYDAIHTMDLPNQNDTPDEEINQLSLAQERIVITKDSDFYYSFNLHQKPYKLLLVRTGNKRVKDLKDLFLKNFPRIDQAFQQAFLVELSKESVNILS